MQSVEASESCYLYPANGSSTLSLHWYIYTGPQSPETLCLGIILMSEMSGAGAG
jgi:hypothetical protein